MAKTADDSIRIVGLSDRLKAEGLTQAALAEQIGFTREYINMLCGGRAQPSAATLLALAQHFGSITVQRGGRVYAISADGFPGPNGAEDPAARLAGSVPSAGVEGVALQMLRERDLEEAELHQVHALVEELHSGHGRTHLVRLGMLAWRRRVWAHKVHEAIEHHAPGSVTEAYQALVRDMEGRGYHVEGAA